MRDDNVEGGTKGLGNVGTTKSTAAAAPTLGRSKTSDEVKLTPTKPIQNRRIQAKQNQNRQAGTHQTQTGSRPLGKPVGKSNRPPWLLMAGVGLACSLGLLLIPRAGRFGTEARRSSRPTMTGINPNAMAAIPQVNRERPKMNLTPAAQIQLSQIASIEGSNPPSLRFRDGSVLVVGPALLTQLSPELQLRLTYSRSDRAR